MSSTIQEMVASRAQSNAAPPTPADVETQTRETYNGPLAVGTDFMAFDVPDDKVEVIANLPK
jgi:hypothetical protein